MFVVSQKSIFAIEGLANADASILLSDSYTRTVVDSSCLYSFIAIKLNNKKNIIKSIDCSVLENYSAAGKWSNPINSFHFYVADSDRLNFLRGVEEHYFSDCNLMFNFNSIPDYSASETRFNASNYYTRPENIISFDPFVENFDPMNDPVFNVYTLPFLPKLYRSKTSIVDNLFRFYSISFSDTKTIYPDIEVPSQAKYILVFPLCHLPVPANRFRPTTSTWLIRTGNIYTSMLLNMTIEEL